MTSLQNSTSQNQEVFVWKKREEKLKKRGAQQKENPEEEEKLRQLEIQRELERAKRRRLEREEGKALWEKEQDRIVKNSEKERYEDWELSEEVFHAEQNLKRQEIRLKEKRPQLVDLLAQNLRLDLDPKFILLSPPYKLLENLFLERIENLKEELEDERNYAVALEAESLKTNSAKKVYGNLSFGVEDYWKDLLVILNYECAKLESVKDKGSKKNAESSSVLEEACNYLEGKSIQELEEIEAVVRNQLDEGKAIDTEYWEILLQNIQVCKSKASLLSKHIELLRNKLNRIDLILQSRANSSEGLNDHTNSELSTSQLSKLKQNVEAYLGRLEKNPNDPGLEDADDVAHSEVQQLQENSANSTKPLNEGHSGMEDILLQREQAKGLEEDEEVFADEVEVRRSANNTKDILWEDKYRPRKPKYFNRVLAGYEWNKYNQTHYDHENPPPKTIQGYKFNIFYPDLINSTKAPTYFIEKADNPDFCIIRFSAGPPYEDIAFKIANREWERSHRKGFRCSFERGILHLWFNFKKYRYRR
eukprot:jgi/Galph1/3598/GphlegSOOS_G2276.1